MSEFKLVHCDNEKSLSQIHEIREKVLFASGEYNRHHPHDRNPNNHCFIFLLNDMPVATDLSYSSKLKATQTIYAPVPDPT